MTIWDKMQRVDRRILYVILVVLVCTGLFFPSTVPTQPDPSSRDFYASIMKVPEGSTVLLQTDWTNSTRGESMGHFENLMRILMSRKIKFVFYSAADPIAPQVARTVINRINKEREAQGLYVYRIGRDYLDLGYFPNAEATNANMAADLRNAWAGRRSKTPEGREIDIFDTEVLSGVRKVGDVQMLIVITASASIDIAIQRLANRVPITAMVTGVTGPGVLPFYQSGQVKGLTVGLKGVYDLEYMMEYGIGIPDANGKVLVDWKGMQVEPITEGTRFARGRQYYGTLHIALLLMITFVILGNVGMFLSRRAKRGEE